MNTDEKPRQFTKEQIRERVKSKATKPSPTIQSTPLAKPKIELKEYVAPLDPKTSAQRRDVARYEGIKHEYEKEMTLSGLNAKQRRHQKKWLKQERKRLRGKQQS
jgi:hypothetical protein